MNIIFTQRAAIQLQLFSLFFAISIGANAQSDTISAITSTDGEHLIRDIFLGGGECFEVFNIQLSGQPGQAGVFSNGGASLGFDEGIILSNGNVEDIMGPNTGHSLGDADVLSTGYGVASADPDLATLSMLEGDDNSNFFDPVVLEFDFTPTLDSISFEFIFASEEYCQFSLSSFIDLFGFFIDGPGLSGPYTNDGINIAVVPGTNQAITARSISPFFNNSFYVNNIPPGELGCSLNQAAPSQDFNAFDGYTVPLVASARVIPCETYHIKLVVSDRGFDDQLDAAVFLKANSFAAGLTSRIASQVTGPSQTTDTSYEGCGSASIIFTRGDSVLTNDLTVYYNLLPGSTATPGLDYTPLPDSVIIPAGVFADTFIIDFFADDIVEGTESFTLKLRNPCDCSESELTITILEPEPLSGSIEGSDLVCSGEALVLAAVPIGGTGEISYEWPNGDQDSIFNILPLVTDTFQVILNDECGSSDTLEHIVRVQSPMGSLDGDFVLCDGQPAVALPVELTDGTSFTFDLLENGVPTNYADIPEGTFQIPVSTTGVYQITNLSADGCAGSTTGEAQVLVVDITTTAMVDSINCFGDTNGAIEVHPLGGSGNYTYIWSHQAGLDTALVEDLGIGTYNVFINDSNGCLDTLSVTLDQPPLFEIEIDTLNLFADCQMLGSLEGQASGGDAPYTFSWSDGGVEALNDNLIGGDYTLSVTDNNNCLRTLSTSIVGDSLLPVVMIQELDSLDCATAMITLDASGSTQNGNLTYEWTDSGNNIIATPDPLMLTVSNPDIYTLSILNNDNNCEASANIQVDVYDNSLNPIISGQADLSCAQDSINLSIANGDPDWIIDWEDINGTSLAANTNMLPVVAGGTYVLIATQNGTNCSGRDTVTVLADFVAPEIVLGTTPDTLGCDLNQIDIDASIVSGSGNYNFQWTGPMDGIDGNATLEDVTATEPGEYQLITVDNSNGCADTLLTTVIESLSSLTINPIPDTLLNCINNPIELIASSPDPGNLVYSWQNSAGMTISQMANAQITAPGMYTISLTDADNDCFQTAQVFVDIDTLAPRLIPNLPEDLSCINDIVTLSTEPGPANYTPTWRNAMGDILPSTNWMQDVDQAGGYSLTIRDEQNGCRSTILFEVGADTIAPVASIGELDSLTCLIDTVDIAPVIMNGSGNYDYQWNGPVGGIVSPANLSEVEVITMGAYSLIVTDQNNGCTDTLVTSVTVNRDDPVLNTLNDTLINCYQPSIILTGSSATVGNLTYSWLDEDDLLLSSNAMVMIDAMGNYQLQLQNLDNGCTDELNINVSENFAMPQAEAGDDATIGCLDTTADLQADVGSPSWIPTWFDPAGTPISTGNWALTTSLPGTYDLVVIDTLNGCEASDFATVIADQNNPVAEAGPPTVSLDCFTGNSIIDLSNSSQGTNILYTLLDAGGAILLESTVPSFTISNPGSYQLVVTNTDNDCQASDDFNLTIDEPVIESVITTDIACGEETGSIVFDVINNGSGPYLYSIDGGTNYLNSNVFLNLSAGTYDLMVQDANGCETTAVAGIADAIGVEVILPQEVELKLGDPYLLNPLLNIPADQLISIAWSNDPQLSCIDCLQPTFTAQQTSYLEVTVIDLNGCSSSAKILLIVDETVPVFVPNVFSPNNEDGVNDRFTIYGDAQQISEVLSLQIHDRWGGIVFTNQNFQINDPSQGWDGHAREEQLNRGVFVYWAEILLHNGERVIIKGDVLLID